MVDTKSRFYRGLPTNAPRRLSFTFVGAGLAIVIAAFVLIHRKKPDAAENVQRVISSRVTAPPNAIPVQNFIKKSRTLDVVHSLAVEHHVLIGVYGNLIGYRDPTIDISIKNGTLEDVLNAIVKADTQFKWYAMDDGIVHFMSGSVPLSLMNVTVHKFEVHNLFKSEFQDALFKTPELRRWAQTHNCDGGSSKLQVGGSEFPSESLISLQIKDVPLPKILDEVAARSQSYYWSAIQYSPSPCGVFFTYE